MNLNYVTHIQEKNVKIAKPEVQLVVHEKDNKVKAKPGETLTFWTELKLNGKTYNPENPFNVYWNGLFSLWNESGPIGENNKKIVTIPGWISPGQQEVSVTAYSLLGSSYSGKYSVLVEK